MNHIGISHFPVLHRQFSSPTSIVFSEPPTPNQDLTQDNKDVLIERLNDLVSRLSLDSSVEDGIVSAIHGGVDRIEALLKNREKAAHKKSPSIGNEIFGGPLTPTQNLRMHFPETQSPRLSITREESFAGSFNGLEQLNRSPTSHRQSVSREAPMGAKRAIEVAKSAEELASKLAVTVAELQVRREESDVSFTEFNSSTLCSDAPSDNLGSAMIVQTTPAFQKSAALFEFLTNISQHIHDMLVTRAEMAAERILILEYRVKEMLVFPIYLRSCTYNCQGGGF